jgi:predicted nucleic acid-binding protein
LAILRIYLDTDGLLDLVSSKSSQAFEFRKTVGLALENTSLVFVTSQLTILEALVHAVKEMDAERELIIREFLTPSNFIETKPVTLQVIEDALVLRAKFGLKSPDAIHIATGVSANCSAFLTKDRRWSKLGFSILGPSELVALLGKA